MFDPWSCSEAGDTLVAENEAEREAERHAPFEEGSWWAELWGMGKPQLPQAGVGLSYFMWLSSGEVVLT